MYMISISCFHIFLLLNILWPSPCLDEVFIFLLETVQEFDFIDKYEQQANTLRSRIDVPLPPFLLIFAPSPPALIRTPACYFSWEGMIYLIFLFGVCKQYFIFWKSSKTKNIQNKHCINLGWEYSSILNQRALWATHSWVLMQERQKMIEGERERENLNVYLYY